MAEESDEEGEEFKVHLQFKVKMWSLYNVRLLQPWSLHLAEPITLRDADLWRFEIWRLFILQYHQHQTPLSP